MSTSRRAILERKDRKKQPSAKRGDGDVEMVDVRYFSSSLFADSDQARIVIAFRYGLLFSIVDQKPPCIYAFPLTRT